MNNQPVYRKNQIQTLILLLKVLELKSHEDNFFELVLFLARYSFLFENPQDSVNSCTSEVPQIYTEQAFSDWSMKYTDPTGLSDEDGIPSLNFKIEPIYDYEGNFAGYGDEGKQRAEALEKARPFYFQFEGRNKKNTITESYDEIFESYKNNGDWSLLTPDMSILHQNGIGDPELKFICKDGREAVFTKDLSKDGTYELYTDPRYMGTYNYCNPAPAPKGITDVKGIFNFIGKSIIGHGCLDVIPYYITGKRNVRDSATIVK